jgi:hypothetical protein
VPAQDVYYKKLYGYYIIGLLQVLFELATGLRAYDDSRSYKLLVRTV